MNHQQPGYPYTATATATTTALPHNNMDFFRTSSTKCSTATMTDPLLLGNRQQQRVLYASSSSNLQQSCLPAATPANPTNTSTEAAVSEALLTLSSARPSSSGVNNDSPTSTRTTTATGAPATQPPIQCHPSMSHFVMGHPPYAQGSTCHWPVFQQQKHSVNHNLAAAVMVQQQRQQTPKTPHQQQQQHQQEMTTSFGCTNSNGSMAQQQHRPRPVIMEQEANPVSKKARTVSPPPAIECATAAVNKPHLQNTTAASTPTIHKDMSESVSCVCPVCNRHIKGLGDHKVDWSQPIQGRQRAKTISSIKKHVKDFHDKEPIWNVIVNSVDVVPTAAGSSSNSSVGSANPNNRIVTAPLFVTQALKKAALDQIPNAPEELRSLRWTEKMMDQRVGIAKGFIQFGGQEFLRNKECQDEMGQKINPKSLRNLAYSMLQTMYDELMQAWKRHQTDIEAAMATASMGLLRNRFQLLFAAPDQWSESWYMDPSKYVTVASTTTTSV